MTKTVNYSDRAINKYPDVFRENYFTDSDYKAACERIHDKRIAHDKIHYVKPANLNKKPKNILNSDIIRNVSIDGVIYKSALIASRELLLNESTVNNRLRNKNFPTWFFIVNGIEEVLEKGKTRNGGSRKKQVSIDGIIYNSVSEAAKVLKISSPTVGVRIRGNLFKEWIYVEG